MSMDNLSIFITFTVFFYSRKKVIEKYNVFNFFQSGRKYNEKNEMGYKLFET